MENKKLFFFGIFLLCGLCFAEKVVVNIEGYKSHSSTVVPITIEWNDAWFEPFAQAKYNHELARAAGALCAVSYNSAPKDEYNIMVQTYSAFGVNPKNIFWRYKIDYTDKEYGINQAAFSLARKKLPSGRDLVFIVIRGTPGNEEEWLSNINVWNSFLRDPNAAEREYHEGFLGAVSQIEEHLEKYVQDNGIDLKKASVLITGHSRGAASANLLAGLLADQDKISIDRTFVYTFATPNVTVREDAHDEKYNFIFNIVNGEDIVPTVPPYEKRWRFTKFGITKAIINSWNCDEIDVYQNEFIPKMNFLYKKLMGREYYPFNTGTFIPSKIGDSMAVINPTTRKFYRGFFPLHKRLAKTIANEFPSSVEEEERKAMELKQGIKPIEENESISVLKRIFNSIKKKADKRTSVLIEYSLNAFIDMHAMQSYLSWLMALDEDHLYSDRQSVIYRIKGVFNGAVVDERGNIYAQIYDGVLNLKVTKSPLAAWQIPIGNFGPISLGFPHSKNYSLLIYRNSIVPTPIRISIERYGPDGSFLGEISKKVAGPRSGCVYNFTAGLDSLSMPDGSPAKFIKLKGLEAKKALKDGHLVNTDVSHMSLGVHFSTDGFWEIGMTSGLQKIYLSTLIGINANHPYTSQSFSLGIGTQHCLCGPVMLNAEAYARFVRYTGYFLDYDDTIYDDKWLFSMVPSTRLMLSIKPAKRVQFFTAFEMKYHISSLNEDLFYSDYGNNNLHPWIISDTFSIHPSFQFGIKL
ncbi:MAG: lipase family protein [Treponema sp.]|nr:lipase family protein [Treponema sp.]